MLSIRIGDFCNIVRGAELFKRSKISIYFQKSVVKRPRTRIGIAGGILQDSITQECDSENEERTKTRERNRKLFINVVETLHSNIASQKKSASMRS